MEKKDILTGRIYPAIHSCVNNRYFILLGIFTFYSFILTSTNKNIICNLDKIQLYGTIALFAITLLNSVNYIFNSCEAFKLKKNRKMHCCDFLWRNKIELPFLIITTVILCFAFKLI